MKKKGVGGVFRQDEKEKQTPYKKRLAWQSAPYCDVGKSL